MSKRQSNLSFIQKTYQIFVRTLYLKEPAHLSLSSNNSGVEFNVIPETVISLNQTFTVTAIDILDEKDQVVDKQISLEIYFKKAQLSNIIFDMPLQKIVKQSKTIFRKQLKDKNGYIDYKFVKCTTRIIRQDEFNSIKAKKEALTKKKSNSFQALIMEVKQKNEYIRSKQLAISSLQNKIHALQREKAELVQRLNDQISKIKQGMNIKIKIGKNTATNHENICFRDYSKLELLKAIKQHERVNKNLEDEVKKLQIQLKIMQEMNEYKENINKSKVSDDNMGFMEDLEEKQQQFTYEKTLNSYNYAQTNKQPKENKSFEYPQSFLNSKLKTKNDKLQQISNISMKSSIILRQKQPSKSIQQKTSNTKKQIIHQKLQQKEQKQQKDHIKVDAKNSLKSSMNKSQERSKVIKSISIKADDDSNIDQLKYHFQHLRIQYQQQQRQNSILKQELYKRSKQIQNLFRKISDNDKQKIQMQRQKAKMLQTFVSKLSLGDNEQNVKAVMKQITNFSKQITKQKDQHAKDLNKLKNDLQKQQANNMQLQIKYSKTTVKINSLNSQLIDIREKYRKQKENYASTHKELSHKQIQSSQLLQQLIETKKLFEQLKQSYDLLEIKSKEQSTKNEQNLALKEQVKQLANRYWKISSNEKNYKLLQQRYNELEQEQDQIRIKLVKFEDDFNKVVKDDNLPLYQEEMDRILVIIFQEVATFQKSFYHVLRVATKAILQNETKYYESFQTVDSFSRQSSRSEKDSKISGLRANVARYQERLNTKIQSLQVQINNFEEGIKIVQQKIIDLEKFKDGIYDLLLKSQHLSTSQLLPPRQNMLRNSSISKSKISIQDIQVLQQEQGQQQSEQQQKQQSKKSGQLKVPKQKGWQRRSQQMLCVPKLGRSIEKMDIKQSNFMHVSSKFELSKLKHSISVKRSLLNEGVGITSSKLFGTLYDSTTELRQSSIVIDLKKEMSIERMKIRDRQFKNFQQTTKLIKKIDTSLIDQKLEKDRLINQHQKRQRDLQIQFEKLKHEFKEKGTEIDKITNQLTAQSQQKAKIIEQNNIIKAQIIEALKQVQQTSEFLFTLQDERDELLAQRQKHRAIMSQYEQSERQMMLQLQTIKQYSKINQATLQQLIQQRNRSFESLESIHKRQVKKMKETILLLQSQITLQSQENITQKTNLQKSIIIKDEELQVLKNKISSLFFTQQNLSQQLQRAFAQKQQLQHEIEVYQKNIYELSDQFEAKQKEILRQQLKIRTQQKQYQICKTIQKQLIQRQQLSKTDIINTLNNYKKESKCWEDSFNSLQEKQNILIDDSKRKEQESIQLKRQIVKINQLLKKRQDTILNLQRQMRQSQLQLSKFKQANQSLKYEIQELIKKEKMQSAKHSNKVSRKASIKRMKSDEYPSFISLQKDLGNENTAELKFNQIMIQQLSDNNEKEYEEELIQIETFNQLQAQCAYNAQLIKQKQEITVKNANLLKQNAQLERLVNQLRSKLAQYNKQMEKISLAKKKFDEKIKEKQTNIQMLISELLSYQKQIQFQQKQNEMLKTKLQIATQCKRSSQLTHHQLVEMRNQIQKNRSIICHLSEKMAQNELLLEKYKKTNQVNSLKRNITALILKN